MRWELLQRALAPRLRWIEEWGKPLLAVTILVVNILFLLGFIPAPLIIVPALLLGIYGVILFNSRVFSVKGMV